MRLRFVFLLLLISAVGAVPRVFAAVDRTPPAVARASHDGWRAVGFSGKLVPGDVLTVTVEGERGCTAVFDVGVEIRDQPMTEQSPGVYVGSYGVRWGDQGTEVAVLVRLRDRAGNETRMAASGRPVSFDTRARLTVVAQKPLLPADSASETRLAVRVADANDEEVSGHEVALALSTVEDYTGAVGGGKLQGRAAAPEDGGSVEVRWGGVSDAFGEVAATYTAGFAAKTALILAKDLTTGDVGVGWLNTYVSSTATVQLVPRTTRASERRGVIRVVADPPKLTADGRSTARVRAWLSETGGRPLAGARVEFVLAGENGRLRVLRDRTDGQGLAEAEYRAGTVAGVVTVSVSAPQWSAAGNVQILLTSDAPARIDLVARPVQMPADGSSSGSLALRVTDAQGNPNQGVAVSLVVLEGRGRLSGDLVTTDRDGRAEAQLTAGTSPGPLVIEAKYTSRPPSEAELRRAYGTVFLPRLYERQERDRFRVKAWLVEPGEEVEKGTPLVTLESRRGTWNLAAPEKGVFVRRVLAERDRAELGDTLGYVEIDRDVWARQYNR